MEPWEIACEFKLLGLATGIWFYRTSRKLLKTTMLILDLAFRRLLPALAVSFCMIGYAARGQQSLPEDRNENAADAAELNNVGDKPSSESNDEQSEEKSSAEVKVIIEALHKAADQGDVDAQCKLAESYYNGDGDGVSKDKVEAAKWYRKAAEQGNASA